MFLLVILYFPVVWLSCTVHPRCRVEACEQSIFCQKVEAPCSRLKLWRLDSKWNDRLHCWSLRGQSRWFLVLSWSIFIGTAVHRKQVTFIEKLGLRSSCYFDSTFIFWEKRKWRIRETGEEGKRTRECRDHDSPAVCSSRSHLSVRAASTLSDITSSVISVLVFVSFFFFFSRLFYFVLCDCLTCL